MRFRSLCFLSATAVLTMACGYDESATTNSSSTRPQFQVSNTDSKKSEGFFAAIDPRAVGVYLPRNYIESLKATRNHSLSIHSPEANYRSLLIVQQEIIYSNIKWHDQYAISESDGHRFEFGIVADRAFIKDEKGYVYDRISTSTEDGYTEIRRFVIRVIFDGLSPANGIEIVEDKIRLKSLEFSVELDDMFYPKNNNLILWNSEREIDLGLIISNRTYRFFEIDSVSEEPWNVNSDRVYFQTDSQKG